jgi:hypothetical protein
VQSIYERELGDDFDALHPKIQERFGFTSEDTVACIGEGTMEIVRNGGLLTLPFLYAGTIHNVMFPEEGTAVPFTVSNYAYEDEYGRETVTWIREFETPRYRRFDARMIYSEHRDRIVDYLGTREHLAVDIDIGVHGETDGITIETGAQRLYAFGLGLPFPRLLTGEATVHEWYDDSEDRYRIAVHVDNALVGTLFEYRGHFAVDWVDCETPPDVARPKYTRKRD